MQRVQEKNRFRSIARKRRKGRTLLIKTPFARRYASFLSKKKRSRRQMPFAQKAFVFLSKKKARRRAKRPRRNQTPYKKNGSFGYKQRSDAPVESGAWNKATGSPDGTCRKAAACPVRNHSPKPDVDNPGGTSSRTRRIRFGKVTVTGAATSIPL